jgi:integrase
MVVVGAIRGRAIRGPTSREPEWYWRAELNQNGLRRTVWTGRASRSEVELLLAELLASGDVHRPAPKTVVTSVRDLLECWVARQDERSDIAPRTCILYRRCARRVAATVGDVRLDRLDLTTLERYRDTRSRDGYATSTIRQDFTTFRMAWCWGRELGVCPGRALPKVTLRQRPKANMYTPTREEMAKVLEVMPACSRVAWPCWYALMLAATGARPGDLSKLRWRDVDLTPGRVAAQISEETKTGARWVPITSHAAVRALQDAGPNHTEAFVFGVKPLTAENQFRFVYLPKACEKAGVRRFTPMGFRRFAVNEVFRVGDPGTEAKLLGHSVATALQYYRQVTREDLRDASRAARLGHFDEGQVIPFPKVEKG